MKSFHVILYIIARFLPNLTTTADNSSSGYRQAGGVLTSSVKPVCCVPGDCDDDDDGKNAAVLVDASNTGYFVSFGFCLHARVCLFTCIKQKQQCWPCCCCWGVRAAAPPVFEFVAINSAA